VNYKAQKYYWQDKLNEPEFMWIDYVKYLDRIKVEIKIREERN